MGFSFTNIAFDALNCGSCDHRNGIRPRLDRDPIRVLEPVTVGIWILDSLGRSGHPGIFEIDLDHKESGVERPSRNQQRLASLAARISAVGDGVADERFRRPVAAALLLLIGLGLRGV